ncbi:MAG: hypothetical protein U1F10_07415 [Burkholderiales bacterium]
MPHVAELRPAVAAAAVALALLAGCTEPSRRPPVLAAPAGENLAHVPAPVVPPANAVPALPDELPLATTGVSLSAGRRG